MVRSVLILGFPGVQSLDLVGPSEVFHSSTPCLQGMGRTDDGYDVRVVSRNGEPATTGFDHFFGLSVRLNRFPDARVIATPKSVQLMHQQLESGPLDGFFRRWWPRQLSSQMTTAQPYEDDTFTLEGHELHIIVLNGTPSCSLHPGSPTTISATTSRFSSWPLAPP